MDGDEANDVQTSRFSFAIGERTSSFVSDGDEGASDASTSRHFLQMAKIKTEK